MITNRLTEKRLKDGRTAFYISSYNTETKERKQEKTGIKCYRDKNSDYKKALEQAKRLLAKKDYEANFLNTGQAIPNKSFLTFLDDFIETTSLVKQSDRTFKSNLNHYLNKIKWNGLTFERIDLNFIEGFKKYLLENVSQNSARLYMARFAVILKQAEIQNLYDTSKIKHFKKIKKLETERKYLTIEEIEKIAQSPCDYPDLKRSFLTACFTGLRISDLRALRYSMIKRTPDGFQIPLRQTKTRTIIYVDLNQTAKELIFGNGNIIDVSDNLVFPDIPKNNLTYRFKKWLTPLGITSISFHNSRHSFAVMALKQTGNIALVQQLLGQKEIQSTLVYAKVMDEDKRNAINLLPTIKINP